MILKTEFDTKTMKQTMHFRDIPVLEYEIAYPEFRSAIFFKSTQKLNQYYRRKAFVFEKYCRTALYRMAAETAGEAIKRGFPVMKFEAVDHFSVTYNENCALSLYFDRYLYSGGAHGSTERSSDSWELSHYGSRIELAQLFPAHFPYESEITKSIISQIAQQIEQGAAFFEEYEQNVTDTFREENFYLTPEGLMIYFQQYDIAPYSSGLPQFLIPYQKDGPMPPRC